MKRLQIIIFLLISLALYSQDSRIGFQSHLTTYGISPSALDLEIIEAMADAGMTWSRHWIIWHQVESDSGVYNFSHQDSIINSYTRNGINVYITLMGGNMFYDHDSVDHSSLSRPELGLAPTPGSASLDGWLNFVDTLVKRYRDRVQYWSIWNEPNLEEFWSPEPNANEYAYLLKVTSEKIKSIDPIAKIIGGNLSMLDFPFFSEIADSIIPYVDYIGYHPYRNFPEDDQQNLLPWGTFPAEESLYSFEEEMDAFVDSIRARDSLGRVGLWDDESGYPSNPEPQLFTSNPANTEITQTKYLLRKYLLSLAYNARVSIWWWSFDVISNAFNVFSDTWFTDFYEVTPEDWAEKGGGFFFNYIGLTYTPYYGVIAKEAEDADTLKGAWQNEGTYISVPDSITPLDTSNVACYSIPISEPGKYTIWIKFRNPDTLKQPGCVVLVDSFSPSATPYAYVSPYPSDTAFKWILAGDAELLKNEIYWYKGPHYFNLTNDTLKLFIVPFFGSTQIDKIYLNHEENVSAKKNALYVTGNIASLFNENVVCDTSFTGETNNIDVDSADYAALRKFAYRDTVTSESFLAYWLGIASDDTYPTSFIDLWLVEPQVDSIVLFNLMTSVESNVTYRTNGDTIFIDSIPLSDAPNVLILAKEGSGIKEDISTSEVAPHLLSNPVINEAVFSLSVTGTSAFSLEILDITGRSVGEKTEKYASKGNHLLRYNTSKLPQGIYFWKISSDNNEWKGKLIVFR